MRFDPGFLEDIKARVLISSLIGMRVTFDRKKTNAARGDYWACCPFHGEKGASFHCEDKKGRYYCFGCGASGNHFEFLKTIDGVSFKRAVEIVADFAGMPLPDHGRPETEQEKLERDRRAKQRAAEDAKRQEHTDKRNARRKESAGAIWKETVPLAGTPGAAYFEWRGLPVPNDECIRFHPGIPYPTEFGDAPGLHPTVMAKVQGPDGAGVGIWRIYLQPGGEGKLEGVDKPKLGLGVTGGGAARLGGLAKHIGIAEGVETAYAVRALGQSMPVWAGLSTSGIIGFKIPEGVETVTVFPDRDGRKVRTRDDGRGVKESPGLKAWQAFVQNNPGRDIRLGAGPENDDYLELYQRLKGHPIR